MKSICSERTPDASMVRSRLRGALSNATLVSMAALISFAWGTSPVSAMAKWETIAIWHMNETSGTTMRDAVRVSAVSPNGRSPGRLNAVRLGRVGVKGRAYGFDGTSSYVTVPHADLFEFGTRSIRITACLRTSVFGHSSAGDDLVKSGYFPRSPGLFKMEQYPDGRVPCGFKSTKSYTGDIFSISSVVNPPPAKPAHYTVTCVLDQTIKQAQVIVDGVVEATRTADVGAIFNRGPIMIGVYPAAGYYNGTLDKMMIQMGTCRASQCPIDGLTYIASYGDLIQTLGADEVAGQRHYLQHGQVEGRDPYLFNPLLYVANDPDLRAAFGTGTRAAAAHYIQYGYFEGGTYQAPDREV